MYMRCARVGARDTGVGANLVAKWYERNIQIFANLQGIVDPGDRVLVIIGSVRATILRHLIIASDPEMSLVGSDVSLSRLALELGFYDQPHFTRIFKAHVGCPPGEYRRRTRDASA